MLESHPLIAIIGPTGAGKSDLALHLAQALGGEILNYDSVQVYRGLDIGSAKTPPGARLGIPHHLIDIIDPDADLTAGEYARIARETLGEIQGRGALPILAGGTGLYLRAVLDGLSPAPERDPGLRIRLRAIAQRRPAALHRFLSRQDPAAAGRIHANDLQKLIRAIELTLLAGRPASQTQSQPRQALAGFRVLKLGLNPDRVLLHERLNRRCQTMFADGLLKETSDLLASSVRAEAKSLQSLGYKQALQIIEGAQSLHDAVTDCQAKTRQYAKRQMTWFRAEQGVEWLAGFGNDPSVRETALAHTRQFIES